MTVQECINFFKKGILKVASYDDLFQVELDPSNSDVYIHYHGKVIYYEAEDTDNELLHEEVEHWEIKQEIIDYGELRIKLRIWI